MYIWVFSAYHRGSNLTKYNEGNMNKALQTKYIREWEYYNNIEYDMYFLVPPG